MTVLKFPRLQSKWIGSPTTAIYHDYCCDTVAERDAITGQHEGERCHCKDTHLTYLWDATSWVDITSGGSGSGLTQAQVLTRCLGA